MVEWILVNSNHIPPLLHYLDDFITTSPLDSSQCAHNLRSMLTVCKWLGLPLHPWKCEGPAIVLVVLGIDLDSVNQAARLPADKLSALRGLISSWLPHKWCSRCEMDPLIQAIYVMLPNWCGLAEPTYAAWSTFCAAFARRIIWFTPTRSFTWTCSGGISSCHSGIGLASRSFQVCSLKLMWRFLHRAMDCS